VEDRTSINVRTRRLGMILRRLRLKSGLTGGQVAKRVGLAASTISRAESGKRGITREDLASVLTVFGVERPLRNAVLKLHAESHMPDLLDRDDLRVHQDLGTWIGFEQDATKIYNYEPLLIPGLLQTFPYARAVIEGFGIPLEEAEIANRVAARIARQSLLRRPNRPELEIVLHEAALHQQVGGTAVMREQLGYLVEAAYRTWIDIRIIPSDAGAHAGMYGPFVIMEYPALPSIVHLENMVASLYLEEPGDVATYKVAFDSLLAVAHPPERSAELIGKIASGMG
jgi:transcriptional regulator with XRE-family HTH domain